MGNLLGIPNLFIMMFKNFTDSAKWHYTSKPKHDTELFGFPASFTVADPTKIGQKTYNIWLNSPEAQAAAVDFDKVIWHNPTTKQTMTDAEYKQHQQSAEVDSESVDASF